MVDFLKYKWLYFTISAIVILSGLLSIWRWGYNYSIDFVGGSSLQYQLDKNVKTDDIKKVFSKDKVEVISVSENDKVYSIRTKAMDEKTEAQVKKDIQDTFKTKLTVLSSETVGPTLGKEMVQKTIIAALLGVLGILIYITFAFRSFNFALAAILALIHDFLVVVGTYAIFSKFLGAQVDTLFVTALLTTMAFSVHDTIIIFDKIRDYKQSTGISNIEHSVNKALTETLVRSLNNSMTIIFMLLALVLLGGTTIKFFVLALLVGTATGAYSSPFIAAPLLVWLEKMRKK
jgi:preprotein translocase subunit SecF